MSFCILIFCQPWCKVSKMKVCCSKKALAIYQDSAHKEVMARSAILETTNKKIDSMPGQSDKEAARMELQITNFIAEKNLPINISQG